MTIITGLKVGLMMYVVILVNLVVLMAAQSPYEPTDHIVLDCTGPKEILSSNGQGLQSSSNSDDSKNLQVASVYRTSNEAPGELPKGTNLNACRFQKRFVYTFPVSPGMKFVRFHFYPSSELNIFNALFSVTTTGPYTLLSTSNSSYSKNISDIKYVIKEFCVNVNDPVLNITFTPSKSFSPLAYGFVNKIEIISMPSNLYIQNHVSFPSKFVFRKLTALEMMYRLNVGGPDIPAEKDTGMLRIWLQDEPYLVPDPTTTFIVYSKVDIKYNSPLAPPYTGPLKVYSTARVLIPTPFFNLSWAFPLESGFSYLVRLHFCEITRDVTQENQRNFQVHINNQLVEDHADVIKWSGGPGVPVYRDYVVNFSRGHTKGEQKFLELHLESKIKSTNIKNGTMLNGLEIFKLSDDNGNLAGRISPFNSETPIDYSSSNIKSNITLFRCLFSLFTGILMLSLLLFILWHLPRKYIPSSVISLISLCMETRRKTFMERISADHHCRSFSLVELKKGTKNFSQCNLIGDGGFGKVYKGYIDKGATAVAIKRANPMSHQGLHEFQTEITMLSKLRNRHVVSLIGYCTDDKEMILVYDFIAGGALRDHLYNNTKWKTPLPWKLRLEICIGAAQGLNYLHTGTKETIIHRDVKTTNILLDERWVAKVADFGLSKLGPNMLSHSETHVSTLVKGSFGYLDPEYYRRQKLTEKSDVYSFGVVLFEVICGRPAVLPQVVEREMEDLHQVNLAEWVKHCHQSGNIDQVVDQHLSGKIEPNCFKTFTEIGIKCLAERGSDRPSMNEIVWNLELARQQQDGADSSKQGCSRRHDDGTQNFDGAECSVISTCVASSDAMAGAEFTDIMFPAGR